MSEREGERMTYEIQYQVGTYSGRVTVGATGRDEAIARAKRQVLRLGPPAPMYYEHWRIVREYQS